MLLFLSILKLYHLCEKTRLNGCTIYKTMILKAWIFSLAVGVKAWFEYSHVFFTFSPITMLYKNEFRIRLPSNCSQATKCHTTALDCLQHPISLLLDHFHIFQIESLLIIVPILDIELLIFEKFVPSFSTYYYLGKWQKQNCNVNFVQ